MKEAYLYIRVSTLNQGNGLEAQQRALEMYCKEHNINSFKLLRDEGVSGSKERRPGLDTLMDAVKRDEVTLVVVYSFSRFARSTKHLIHALELFKQKNIGFISISERIDTSTPTGKFVFSILASVAELERELIRERVRNGLANAKAKGIKLGRPKQSINTELIKHLRSQKMSHRKISQLVGCSPATVCRELKKIGSKSVA